MFADAVGPIPAGAVLGVLLIALLAVGMRVPFALAFDALVGFAFFLPPAHLDAIGSVVWDSVNKPLLAAVPLFVLMGELFSQSALSNKTYSALSPLASRIAGGLWHSNIAACAVFSAASGSSVGTAAAMGSIAAPQLNERGYPRRISYGSLVAGGTLGILIPPSLGMIIYGSLTGVSIGALFIAGLIPGIVLALMFSGYIAAWSLRHRSEVPTADRAPILVGLRALAGVGPLLVLVGLVLGSLYFGFATPTESAAVGAFGIFLLTAVYGPRDRTVIAAAIRRSVGVSVMILLILMGASLLTYVVGFLRIPRMLTESLAASDANAYVILVGLALAYLLLGMFLDPISVMSLSLPVLFPAIVALGFDPVWFGVFVVVNIELGLITPPVGLNLFIIKGVDPTGTWGDIVLGSVPFAAMMLVFLVVLAAWPQLALWLVPT